RVAPTNLRDTLETFDFREEPAENGPQDARSTALDRQTRINRDADGVRGGPRFQPLDQAAPVALDRARADPEIAGDLLVRAPLQQAPQNLPLPARQFADRALGRSDLLLEQMEVVPHGGRVAHRLSRAQPARYGAIRLRRRRHG